MARCPGPKVGCCLPKLWTSEDCSQKKATRTKAGLSFPGTTSYLHLRHWNTGLSFLWTSTVLHSMWLWREVGFCLLKLWTSEGCSQMKATRADRSGWSWPPRDCRSHTEVPSFPSCGKEPCVVRSLWPKVGFCLLKLQTSEDCSQWKTAKIDRSGWHWPPSSCLTAAPETLVHMAFLPLEKRGHFWPGAHGAKGNSTS